MTGYSNSEGEAVDYPTPGGRTPEVSYPTGEYLGTERPNF
jgi:hypothetical protein